MNIKEAKKQIKNAMTAYFSKNKYGSYKIPIEKQRPVFLMGPPGIGKTAIMEQVAAELGVGLVSYSMTHHTRQSALGLPFIAKKNYGGVEYDVSEYTMSEIIASVYDMMEETGKTEGILFLDEINCVSETLAPAMLQFLQYKVFGRHRVPDGWIVVTAGNPPEYNNSVREFDIVTWDRLKRIDVEPDYEVWKEYAYKNQVHSSILTYLDIKKEDFYKIETTIDGKSFVTARGWSDLSDMIILYEENGLEVDEMLISQYVQNKNIAKDFAVYYDLFNKYKSDYQVDQILDGSVTDDIKVRANLAGFDERLALLGLIISSLTGELKTAVLKESIQSDLLEVLKETRMAEKSGASIEESLADQLNNRKKELQTGRKLSRLSSDDEYKLFGVIEGIEEMKAKSSIKEDSKEKFIIMKNYYDDLSKELRSDAEVLKEKLANAFKFIDAVFGSGQEMLILVTELTINYYSAHFISKYGCKEYFEHNKDLLFYERHNEIMAEIENLSMDFN